MDSEIQIFQNALEFHNVKAREVMVPRTDLVAVELHESIKTVTEMFTSTGYTKILVYRDSFDDILGYVHAFDLFKKPKTIRAIIMPVEFVPETMLVNDILNVLTKKRKSMAVVLDEYGGTSGILTVEDIVEELFGEIEDEHDSIELLEEKIDDKHYKFSARLEVDFINETYKLNLPESEHYETLGGLIVDSTEEIPEKVEEILDYMLGLLDESLVLKNIYKSYQYFDMWKELVLNKKIKLKMLKMEMFGKLIDLLMGSESIFSTKDKKRAEFNMA